MKAIASNSLAAYNIMQLKYQSRETPDVNCEIELRHKEWQSLYMLKHKTNMLPNQPPP